MDDTGEFGAEARATLAELQQLEEVLSQAETEQRQRIDRLPPAMRDAARNLVHYIALRQLDIRPLQHRLTQLGLSSLGRAEIAVEDAVQRAGDMLRRALREPLRTRPTQNAPAARAELSLRARELLGADETPAVMVTMPSEAAEDPALIRDLLAAGMSVMRVNCAHDSEQAWKAMVAHLRRAERELDKRCQIVFDLPGPKLRTLAIAPGPRVEHVRPVRDDWGEPVQMGQLVLRGVQGHPSGEPQPGEIWVPLAWVRELSLGDELALTDLRGKRRRMRVTRKQADAAECEAERAIYLGEETLLQVCGAEARAVRPVRVRTLPRALHLQPGDSLLLKTDGSLGRPAQAASSRAPAQPASISCALPQLLTALSPGQSVWFDDGKIGATVVELSAEGALLRVRQTRVGGALLKSERGINLPDTDLSGLPLLSAADLEALDVASAHADSIGLSFTRSAQDVATLHQVLAERGLHQLGVILKIETRAGFEALPEILFEALKRPRLGVMIARGDLAVECGFERLAELQEEMLWLCEAARVPCIWATQVLEGLTKKGRASRAEITDAAMAERAECVMLNKGPYLRDAVRSLRDILARMRGHQEKKRSMLRPLRSVHLNIPRA